MALAAWPAAARAQTSSDADGYVERVAAALQAMQAAQPDKAAEGLRAAMRLDANHPAAWLAYGALLLDTRNPAAARRCFARAAEREPESARLMMGLALCDLVEGKTPEADRRFREAGERGAAGAIVHRAYLAAMQGRAEEARALLDEASPAERDAPLGRGVAAALAGAGADPELWTRALESMRDGRPLLASFTPWKPFNHGWQARPTLPMPPGPPTQILTGAVPLSGVTAEDTTHVVFTIDGVSAGITNVRPFGWTWDTTAYPNGWHTVRVTAYRRDGASVSQERRVWVRNPGAPHPSDYAGIAAVNAALERALRLEPDARYARIVLARAAIAAGQTEGARAHLQNIVADDPKYWDAAALLKGLPAASAVEIWDGPKTPRRIALTFDDGPNARRTPPLLDLLDQIGIPATFFIVGKQAAAYPDVVRRMARSGHHVENHTYNHPNIAKLTQPEALRELAANSRLLTSLTGRAPRYFRPPGGNTSAAAREAAAMLGMSPAMWSFASGKIEGLPVEDMLPAMLAAARPGAIYLVHNGTDKILEVLPQVVRALQAQGYEFVTLQQLMGGEARAAATGPTLSPLAVE